MTSKRTFAAEGKTQLLNIACSSSSHVRSHRPGKKYRHKSITFLSVPDMGVSKNRGFSPPKSSIFIGVSIINRPFWGTTIYGNPHMEVLLDKRSRPCSVYAQLCDSQATVPSKGSCEDEFPFSFMRYLSSVDRRYMNPGSPSRRLKNISFHQADYFVSELYNHPNLGLIFLKSWLD